MPQKQKKSMKAKIDEPIVGIVSAIEKQIDQAHVFVKKMLNGETNKTFHASMGKLESLVRTTHNSIERLSTYYGEQHLIRRPCLGQHPGRKEVKCNLCDLKRCCAYETKRRQAAELVDETSE
jgi:hypothetical protein